MKQVYEAAGKTFATAEAAKRHERLLEVQRELEAAANKVKRCLGETALTADGQPFSMSSSTYYWFISPSYAGLPRLVSVWVWPHHMELDADEPKACLKVRWLRRDGDRSDYISLRVNELYADQAKAKAAYVAACKERLAELTEEVAEIERNPQVRGEMT